MKVYSQDFYKPKYYNFLFTGFLIAYGIFLLYLAYQINLSEDETYTLNTTSRSLAGVVRQSYYFEGQPPVYFILLALWRSLYPGIFFIKLFSILMIGLSAFVLYKLTRLFSDVINSKWMMVIFLLNPFTVWAALEVRTYSLLIFLATLLIYFFYRFYFENKIKFLYWFLLTAVVGIYTQYFFTLLITALGGALLIFKGWKSFFNFCLYLIPVVILFLPNLIFMRSQIEMHEIHEEKFSILDVIFSVLHTPINQLAPINVLFNTWLNRALRIIFLIIVVFAWLKLNKNFFKQKNNFIEFQNFNLVSVFFLIILFCITVSVSGIIYMDKYMSVCFPLFILIVSLFRVFLPIIRNVLFCSIGIYYAMLVLIIYRHPVKTYDFKSVALYIEKIERPNEPILFYRSGISLPFRYYYTGQNPFYPLPHEVKYDGSWAVNVKDTMELKQAIAQIKTDSKSYLFISDLTLFESTVNMNRKIITDYLSHNYKISLDTFYTGCSENKPLRIRRLEVIKK